MSNDFDVVLIFTANSKEETPNKEFLFRFASI